MVNIVTVAISILFIEEYLHNPSTLKEIIRVSDSTLEQILDQYLEYLGSTAPSQQTLTVSDESPLSHRAHDLPKSFPIASINRYITLSSAHDFDNSDTYSSFSATNRSVF
jgi:hypothetical protein